MIIVLLLDYWQGEYHDDYLYETGVIAGIVCCWWHRALLSASCVVAGTVYCCWHRTLLLAPCVVVGIVCYRVLLSASHVAAGIKNTIANSS